MARVKQRLKDALGTELLVRDEVDKSSQMSLAK